MSSAEWIGLLSIVSGAVVAQILAQRKNLESMIGKRLDDLQTSIDALTQCQGQHNSRITRIETVLELNGCIEGGTHCDRRKKGAN